MVKDLYGSRDLTRKELQIAHGIWKAKTNQVIALELGATETVVKNHLRVIFDKTGMSTRLELALWYEVHQPDSQ